MVMFNVIKKLKVVRMCCCIYILSAVTILSQEFNLPATVDTVSEIDSRCTTAKLFMILSEQVEIPCMAEANDCIEERRVKFSEPSEYTENLCFNQPLIIDPRFYGPCPKYLGVLESPDYDDNNWLLPKTSLRLVFDQSLEGGPQTDTFKRSDSILSIKRLLDSDPDNLVALSLMRVLLDYDDLATGLKIELKLHELEPDCPESWDSRLNMINSYTEQIVVNWVKGKGAVSNLSEREFIDLIDKSLITLNEIFNVAIDESQHVDQLLYALESINYPAFNRQSIITRIAHLLEFNLENYREERTTELVRRFSIQYDVDSEQELSVTLQMTCNDFAFELGLIERCIEQLEYSALQNVEMSRSFENNWTKAALLLVNAITRDCSPHSDDWLHEPFLMFYERRCFEELEPLFTARINALQSKFTHNYASSDRELLIAFLLMNEISDKYFLRAVELDSNTVVFATNLSKRLYKRNEIDGALNVLNSSIEVINQGRFEPQEWGDNLDIENLKNFYSSVNEGLYKNFFERPRIIQEVD